MDDVTLYWAARKLERAAFEIAMRAEDPNTSDLADAVFVFGRDVREATEHAVPEYERRWYGYR